jgi:hypothetical protein
MILFLKFYFLFLIICTGTFTIGNILFKRLNVFQHIPDFFTRLFFCMLAGSVIIVFIISIIMTKGETISIAFIPLFIALILEYKKNKFRIGFQKELLIERQPALKWILILSGSLFIFGYFFVLFYRGGQFPFVMPKRDTVYYGSLSYYIFHTGQENVFKILNDYSSEYRGVSPYHYFELWFNAFWAEIFNINFSQCLSFLVYPFFVFCYFLSICSLVKILVKKSFKLYFIFPFIFLFVGGIDFSVYGKLSFLSGIKTEGYTDYIIDFTSLKAATIYCFFSAFTILFYLKAYRIAFIVLLFLPVCSIALLPSVIGGILIYYVLTLFLSNLNARREISIPILSVILLLIIFLFYSVFKNPEAGKTTINFYNSLSNSNSLFNWNGIKNMIAILFAYSLISILLYLPYFFTNAKAMIYEEKIEKLFLLLLFISVSGIIAAAFNFSEINSPQLFSLSTNCFANVFIVLLTIWQLENGRSLLIKILACSLLILSLAFSVLQQRRFYKELAVGPDRAYLNKIQDAISQYNLRQGISIRAPREYAAAAREFSVNTYVNGMYIAFYFNDALIPISISDYSANVNSENKYIRATEQQLIESGIFYRFVQQQKNAGDFNTIDESQAEFIEKYNIDYGIISNGALLPELLSKNVCDSFSDPVTGDKFIVFKKLSKK